MCLFLMPAAAESSRVCAPQDVTEMARRLSDLNFLLCEDEPLIALDVEDTLHTLGAWRIATIESSAAAKEWMRGEVLPDVAILDVVLADGPCFPLAEGLLAAGVKILFVTGYAQGIPDGLKACPVVEKPFMAEELAAAILRMVGRSSPAEAEKESNCRDRERHPEEELAADESGSGDAAKAKDSGDEGDDQEDDRPEE